MKISDFITQVKYPKTKKDDVGLLESLYDNIFPERKESTTSLLEIGVKNGYSLLLWRDYFINANILGIDPRYCPNVQGEKRISQITADAYDLSLIKQLGSFDIIIDDGPHTLESMEFFLEHYPKLCNPGGIVILEDILYSSWKHKLMDIAATHSAKVSCIDTKPGIKTKRFIDTWKDHDFYAIVIEM